MSEASDDKKPVENVRIVPQLIEDEMKKAYLDYAMSVIVGRALPDVRDGLKPVHRRILFAMHELGMVHNKPFKKSARIVGEVLGKFHPHGDTAVYDSLVRMAQEFALRYPLIQGQGNFGCFTKDTKVKLTDGRSLSFTELIKEHKEGKKNYTYTFNHKTKRIEIAKIKRPRLTKKKTEIMKIVLDNDREVRCTLNHKFMLRDGTYKEAHSLKLGNSLMPGYTRLSTKEDDKNIVGYTMIHQPFEVNWNFSHHLADECNLKNKTYLKSAGRVRHHKDFNKLNNNPENIQRMGWKEHWKLHAKLASWRHKHDQEYVKKIAAGRKRFIEENKDLLAKRARERNKGLWKNEEFRKRHSKRVKELWKNDAYKEKMSKISSEQLKKKWKTPEFRKHISKLKSEEMKKRWEDLEYQTYWSEKTREISKKIWANPKHRKHISRIQKQRMNNPEQKKKQSLQSKALWQKPSYTAKYPENHFSEMAKKLWQNPKTRELHSKKAQKQWKDQCFKEKMIASVKKRNKKRLEKDPDCMKKLAQRAKKSLEKKWKDPNYKEQVIKSKIAGYVHRLLEKYEKATPELYEEERTNNGIPRLKKALTYYNNFDEMVEAATVYNHTVKEVIFLKEYEDVYDLTIDITHNFLLDIGMFVHNSVDGDRAAAMRYTEARLTKLAEELLADIDKETVDFQPNFDGSLTEPTVLPARVPNLLINGTSGIAVGMATNIPPHNMGEVISGTIALIDDPDITVEELMQHVKGPDFPTFGKMITTQLKRAYTTGRGKVTIKAKATIEEHKKDRERIIITEIPYQVNKANLVAEIADNYRQKKIMGISDIRDESNREGMRIVIELKKDAPSNVVLNQLHKYTRMTITFGLNMLALVDNEPKVLSLKQLIQNFVEHRQVVVRKRTAFELRKAEERCHILEGLLIALDHIDEVVQKIKKSPDTESARNMLVADYSLSETQAKAILDMKLQRLSSLEQQKIKNEHKDLIGKIKELKDILGSEERILSIIKGELTESQEKYASERRTQIEIGGEEDDIIIEDLIKKEDVVVTVSHRGYVKRIPVDTYKQQGRGGKGVIAAGTKEEDFIENVFVANTHTYILFFSNKGQVYWQKVYQIPEGSRQAKGKAIVNLINLDKDEKITAFVPVQEFKEGSYLLLATKKGTVKKTELKAYARPRQGGIRAITLVPGDELVNALLTDGKKQILLATKKGNAVKFHEENARSMGRTSTGVRGVRLVGDDEVVGAVIANDKKTILTITENGYGKRTKISDYRLINRGGKGVINIQCSKRNGNVVAVKSVTDDDDVMFISQNGIIIRTGCKNISTIGRNTQGLRLMRMKPGDRVVSAAKIMGNGEEPKKLADGFVSLS